MNKYYHSTYVKLNGEYLLCLKKNEYEYCYSATNIPAEIRYKILESDSEQLFESTLAQQKFNTNPVDVFGEKFKLISIVNTKDA